MKTIRRRSIHATSIAAAVMAFSQVASFVPSALAEAFTTPFGTQTSAGILGGPDLTMNGGGMLLLGAGQIYTGTTTINDGSVSISSATALGTGTSAIVIQGVPLNGLVFDATRGAGGGNLTVGGGITIGRNFSLRGFGSTGDTGALTNVGNNAFSGTIATGTGANTRIISTQGTARFTETISIADGTTLQFGGNGNTLISGVISGGASATLQKIGSGTLELTGTNTYSGITTLSAGFLRVSDGSNIGSNTGNAALMLGGGILEVRSDAGSFATKGVSASAGTIFLDHAVGSSVLNQTVNFRSLVGNSLTLNGRNGYGATFAEYATGTSSTTITNNLNGLLTFGTGSGASFWNQVSPFARTLAIQGNGNTLINGNILTSGTAAHSLSKSGNGTLTIVASGIGSNFTGATNINGGVLSINSITALNNAATGTASRISIGISAAGALTFTGSGAASDYVVAKIVTVGTGGGATINANQSGNPVIISNFDVTGEGSKTLTLGGTSTDANLISGAIINGLSGTTSLLKIGSGTWALSGANTYSGGTTIRGGTLKVLATGSNVVPDASNLFFTTNGGTLEYVGRPGANDSQTLGLLLPSAGPASLRLSPGVGGTASLVFTGGLSAGDRASLNVIASGIGNTVTLAGIGDGFVDPHITYNGANFAIATTGILSAPIYGTTPGFSTSTTALTTGNHNEITGSITTSGNAAMDTIRSLRISGSQTLTLAGMLTINSQGLTAGANSAGGILQTGGTSTIIGGSVGTAAGYQDDLVIRVNGPSDTLTAC